MSWVIRRTYDMPFESVIGIAWLGDEKEKTIYIGLFWYVAISFKKF